MKRVAFVVVALASWILLFAQPILEFETLEHDFGRILEEAGPYTIDFNFTNTGDESFSLLKVKAG